MNTETNNTETVTVELNVESAYAQLVGFQQAQVAFAAALEADDEDDKMDAAESAINANLEFINELMPQDLSDTLHARLAEEHPELVPQEDPSIAMLREMLATMGLELDK